ncbi:MAG: fructosamine kinase family protein [Solirubrobacteraceae bacterium]
MTLPAGARDVTRVGGGDINEAFHVVLADGSDAFVKTRPDAAPGEYAAEAAGLAWLAEPGALRTPAVLDVDEGYLALEWIAPAPSGRLNDAGAEELGRGLALTHQAGSPCFGRAGGSGGSGGFGWLRLPNEPAGDWPSFYSERRLLPLARLARERAALSGAGVEAVERVCERLPELTGPPEPPARLHGDLWSGNVMADADGRPWLIDPSVYGGHREIDLAMLLLFGTPSARVLAAYEELAPLADGWHERVELYQLLPLLVHALLFGGSYAAAAERVALRYAG